MTYGEFTFFSSSKSKGFPSEEKYLKYLPQSSWSAMYSTDGSEQLKSAKKGEDFKYEVKIAQ